MVGVIEEIDSYLQYLVDKYFVFQELAELDEANTIDDIVILKNNIPVGSFVKTKELSEIINFIIKSKSNILNGALIDCENGLNT